MKKTLTLFSLGILVFCILFPIIYTINASFFQITDFTASPARFFASKLTIANYVKALSHHYYLRYIFNSLITAILTMGIRIAIAFLTGYAFAFFRFRYQRFFLIFLLATLFVPSDALIEQNYLLIKNLHLVNSYLGIISTSLLGASQILMYYLFFLSMPPSLIESARIDGAKDGQIFTLLLIPISRALTLSLLLQTFVGAYNSYLWPLIVTNSNEMRTVQVGITMLGFADSFDYGPLFAAITITLMPFLIGIIFIRKSIIRALSKGYLHM